jgi:cytochrome b6-f complex iron-sulfur subunit
VDELTATEPREPRAVVAVPPSEPGAPRRMSRRSVLRWAFWTGVFASLAAAGATTVNFLFPRTLEAFGGPVPVAPSQIPKPGEPPVRIADAHCLLVNLHQDEARIAGDTGATPGGLLALWWKCPHLGCTVPWEQNYVSPADEEHRAGWFHCPCHGSTYTKAGVRIFGPAPRSMDTMQIDVDREGRVTVQSGKRTDGTLDNPRRAVAYTPPPAQSPPAAASDAPPVVRAPARRDTAGDA